MRVPGPRFQYVRGGLHLPDWRMWLDAHDAIRGGEAVFVSHAHSDHTAHHAEVILTEATRRLMRARVGGKRTEHVLGYGERVDLREGRFGAAREGFLTLLPAGHVLGSAMSLLEDESGSLLYTGDFKLRSGLSAEVCEPRRADVLVMETTFGRPHYVLPPTEEVLHGILRFCQEALADGQVPILLGYSLGKSQEVLSSLLRAGLPVMLADPVAKLTRIYADLGREFPPYRPLVPAEAAGHVVLCPPGKGMANLRQELGRVRVAMMTGWAMDPGCRYQYQVDAAFPLSDHADYPDLLEMVRRVAPKCVYTLHGFAAEFAADVRAMGVEAWALTGDEQLELGLGRRPEPKVPKSVVCRTPDAVDVADGQVRGRDPSVGTVGLVAVFEAIRAAGVKEEKVRLLAQFLSGLDAEDLELVVRWFSGLAVPSGCPAAAFLNARLVREAVCIGAGVGSAEYHRAELVSANPGEVAKRLFSGRSGSLGEAFGLGQWKVGWQRVASGRSASAVREALARLFREAGSDSIQHLVNVAVGDLRLGLRRDWVLEAVAEAFGAPLESVRRAAVLSGCPGVAASAARAGILEAVDVVPMRPLANWVDGMPSEGAGEPGWVRCQVHRVGDEVRVWTPEQAEITGRVPGVVRAMKGWDGDVVLDGWAEVDSRGKQPKPESEGPDLFGGGVRLVPRLRVVDVLWADGRGWIGAPVDERRAWMEMRKLPEGIEAAGEGRFPAEAQGRWEDRSLL